MRRARFRRPEQVFHFGPRGSARAPSEPRYFDRRGGAGECDRGFHRLAFGEGQGKSAMKHISRAQCIHRFHSKRRVMPQFARLQPINALGAIGRQHDSGADARGCTQSRGDAPFSGGRRQAGRGKGSHTGGSNQLRSAGGRVGIENSGDAGRRGAAK